MENPIAGIFLSAQDRHGMIPPRFSSVPDMEHPALSCEAPAAVAPGIIPVSQRFMCHDVDTLAECTHALAVHLDQLSPGPFQGILHEIRLERMQLLRERVNRALLKRGTQAPHTTSFSIPLQIDGAGYCRGTSLNDRMLLVSNGTALPELRTPDQQDIAMLVVETSALQELASLEERNADRTLSTEICLVGLSAARYAALKSLLLAGFEAMENASAALAWPQTRKAVHDAVLLELAQTMATGCDPIQLSLTARRRIVDRVRELVISQPDVPFTVLDICQAVGTSRRKLQYCFEEILGTHPAWYLRVLRLNAVRRELRQHSPATASVGDVACRWGFWHLSRFATHYRQLFGELPSDTLKRPTR
ncbi:helix-turn-helix domain-containing protein [Paraburkholderia silvatlantica]|uniref:helix-turn-helix domain-containing protein n=1 Tax=Paraburkholderia silvatlantica TaxID=321895 RepID=UPI003751C2AC